MKRFLPLLSAFLLALLCLPAAFSEDRPTVRYFYQSVCEACDPEAEFAELFGSLAQDDIAAYDCAMYNVLTAGGRAAYDAAAEELAIPEEERGLPLLVIGDRYYVGQNAIYEGISAVEAVEYPAEDSVIYYVYLPACAGCAKAKEILDTLPRSVSVIRDGIPVESGVTVRQVDMSRELGLAQQLFTQYQVPEDEWMTPAVFFGSRYLLGSDAIAALPELVSDGLAIGTPTFAVKSADTSALSIAGSFAAGLVGGLNPCALSMLILFLTIVMQMDVRAISVTLVFLGAKGITYLVIGTALFSLLSAWNPQWLPLLSKWVMTAIAAALILLNGWDAAQSMRGRYGKVKNQLPKRMRGGLQNRIKTVLEGKRGSLLFSVAALGITVAAGEFLCAGQIYLATILAAVRLGGGATYLVVFCAGFLLPSAAVSAVALRCRSTFRVAGFFRERLALIKLVSCFFFLLMLIFIWMI